MIPKQYLKIVIAGGGTGGHIFPGIAIAEKFMEANPENQILFVGTGKPVEAQVLSGTGFTHRAITAGAVKGVGVFRKFLSFIQIPKGLMEAVRILSEFKPDLVIGVGGYSSGALAIAAKICGVAIVLHEQNRIPGITNRMLSRLADRIYVSFDGTEIGDAPHKVIVTGNPLRKEVLDHAEILRNEDDPFVVMIIGGSQGARSVNLAVMDALKYLEHKERYFFVHQSRPEDEADVREAYIQHGIHCEVRPFFTDMGLRYQKADLLICRAGATTVAEVSALGLPAIFIPYPHAADNHQVYNAKSLSDHGAAEMILQSGLSGKWLAERISFYASHRDALAQMAEKAKFMGKRDAAERIVMDCIQACIERL